MAVLFYYSEGWSDMFTDVFFQNPDQKLAEMASKHVDVYNYVFTHKSENTFCQMFGLPDNRAKNPEDFFSHIFL